MSNADATYVLILGTAQDAGVPQAGCRETCCSKLDNGQDARFPTSLAVIEPTTKKHWLIDCTPRLPEQLRLLDDASQGRLAGVFLTHAHFGHYTGLMYFGREAMNTEGLCVFAMPRMDTFLRQNAPWSQLVGLNNIQLRQLSDNESIELSRGTSISPFLVPHRAEFSETVGFKIDGPQRSVVYLPDIDDSSRLTPSIESIIGSCDIALLDGTFYSLNELRRRSVAEVPHPPIAETMQRLAKLTERDRRKVHFIHFNHTNPVLDASSPEYESVRLGGFHIATEGDRFEI